MHSQPINRQNHYFALECLVRCKNPGCLQHWDRDKNAALNILIRAKCIMHEKPLPAFWNYEIAEALAALEVTVADNADNDDYEEHNDQDA